MQKTDLYGKINRLIHKIGFDVRRFPTIDRRLLLEYLNDNNVTTCFDVGANTGQYAKLFRSEGFNGKILSFEPQSKAFAQLRKNAGRDLQWDVFNIGLGDTDGKSVINISKNSVSSSILHINKSLVKTLPETEYVAAEEISVKRLDNFLKEINFKDRLFLKIDAQGFELRILEGARNCYSNIFALQLELSYVSLYRGEKLFDEMKASVESLGFYLASLENGLIDPNDGKLLQVESIFLRRI